VAKPKGKTQFCFGLYTKFELTTPFLLTNHSRHRVHRADNKREKESKEVIDAGFVSAMKG
jgi:hypothetical protein